MEDLLKVFSLCYISKGPSHSLSLSLSGRRVEVFMYIEAFKKCVKTSSVSKSPAKDLLSVKTILFKGSFACRTLLRGYSVHKMSSFQNSARNPC